MKKLFNVSGMSCGHCVMAVEKELAKLEPYLMKVGIGSVEVEYDNEKLSEENIINAIEEAGYKVETIEK